MFVFLCGLYWRYYSSSSKPPSLELLPNELLLEVFSYASVSDLFYGWLNLNWRFDGLIHSLRIEGICSERKSSSCKQQWHFGRSQDDIKTLRYFASQLVSLSCDTCMINEINLVDYSYLRILKLCEPIASQLDAIQSHRFPHLQHLSLIQVQNFSFEVLCRFKSLRSCELLALKIDAQHSHLSSPIQSLTIRHCFVHELAILLRHFPEMTFFRVFIVLESTLVQQWNPVGDIVHPNVTSLDICFLDMDSTMDQVNDDRYRSVSQVLAFISSNKRIRYRVTLVDTINFDFDQLRHVVVKLDFVYFACRLMWLHRFRTVPNIDCIRQVPLFNKLEILHVSATATLCRSIWTTPSIACY